MRNVRARAGSLVISWALSVVAGAGTILAVPGVAAAQAPPDTPDEAKRKGDEAMVALRYEEALVFYRQAWEATKNPALLYNMGRAYEGLADFPKALDALEEFAEKAPPELKARVPKLDELLRDVRGRVSTIIVTSNVDGAEIRVANTVVGKTRVGQVVLRLNAGAGKEISINKAGYRSIPKTYDLEAGKALAIDGTLGDAVLVVRSPVTGAAVSVDGKAVGTVPSESFVAAGAHKVALQRDGYEPAETSVIVPAGDKKVLDVPMNERQTLLGKWWFWTAAGAAVVAGTVATILIVNTEKDPDTGTIAPGRVKVGLHLGF